MAEDPLRFRVAPHVVEDLGLNLYTSLPRVLVEFVANAYDADSPSVDITFDDEAIGNARRVLKAEFEAEKALAAKGTTIAPLAVRVLPAHLTIEVKDAGTGMSRNDLKEKFLIAGRRRRVAEPAAKGRSTNGRPLMGRKGLGKLAGFGVAKRVEVITKTIGSANATKIVLDYQKLVAEKFAGEVDVEEEQLVGDGGLGQKGTLIRLSKLMYDPLKSRPQTIQDEIAEHFELITEKEFLININGNPLARAKRTHSFSWPSPNEPHAKLIDWKLATETGNEVEFRYRLRFTGPMQALPASRRGVRVYAHGRLASAPSLLAADTNMHGFRMTDYLDGVVEGDFIDDTETDYIATDRQNLRWESPLLSPLWDFLSEEIKEACKQYQKVRDAESEKRTKDDPWTTALIEEQGFGPKDRALASKMAALLESAAKKGVEDAMYRDKLPVMIRAIGHGNIVATISMLAADESPDLRRVAGEVARLTADELDQFITTAKTRLKAIGALRKIVESVDFAKSKDEGTIQEMLEKAPWMIDATYTQFLTADQRLPTMYERLARELKIGKHASTKDKNFELKRPDLVFLIGSDVLKRLIVVELKAPNVELEKEHLDQLELYMQLAEEWLEEKDHKGVEVRGQLIGSLSSSKTAAGVVLLKRAMKEAGPHTKWKVRDFTKLLKDTEAAHKELLDIHEAI